MISFDSSHSPYEVKIVIFIARTKSLRPTKVDDQAKVVWIVNGINGVRIQVYEISKSVLVLGSIFPLARFIKCSTGGNPWRCQDVFVSSFKMPAEILQHSYSNLLLFLKYRSYDMIYFVRTSYSAGYISRCFINPPSLSKVNEKQ